MKTDNSPADGIIDKKVKLKRAKAFDMRFWWLVDRTEQGQFRIYWAPGVINLADYFTKKHPESHHQKLRPIYIYEEGKSPDSLQGCVKILEDAHSRPSRATGINSMNSPQTDRNRSLPKHAQTLLRLVS